MASSVASTGASKSASDKATVAQYLNYDAQELGYKGRYSRQPGQNPALEELLLHLLDIKLSLAYRITITDTTTQQAKKCRETLVFHYAILQAVLHSSKDNSKPHRFIHGKNQ